MADNDWKSRLGVVYSTNPDFKYETCHSEVEVTTPEARLQHLIVKLDKHARAGKKVTLVEGFRGSDADLEELGRRLKTSLGVGGSVKDGLVVIQGDFRDRICTILTKEGYNARRGN